MGTQWCIERPDSAFGMSPSVASSSSLSPDVFIMIGWGVTMNFTPLWKCILGAYCITVCHVSSLSIWAHLLLCFLGSVRAGGWGGVGHRSTVLNSLMQFSNATYSFHVSLESFTCEIAKACLAWATRHSRGRVTPKRQMWEGERN